MVLSRDMDQKKKKYRILLMQLSCAVLLVSDAAAWAFRGSPGSLERGIVYVSNYLVWNRYFMQRIWIVSLCWNRMVTLCFYKAWSARKRRR